MDRWRRWFRRPGRTAVNLSGRGLPDGDVPGRFRQLAAEELVPDLRKTSRCDGAIVYEQPERRWTDLAANQRVDRYERRPLNDRNRGWR